MRKSDIVKFAAGTALLLPNLALAYGMAPRGAPMGSPNMMYGHPYVGMSFNFTNVDATVENSSGSRLSFNVDNNSLAGVMLGLRVTPTWLLSYVVMAMRLKAIIRGNVYRLIITTAHLPSLFCR